jgi:CRISPR-associated protein Csm4
MKRWRAVLEMRSPLATPLTAGRLFGHICWGLAWHEGPEAVSDLLTRMAGPNPPLVLGSPSPVNFVPMPEVLRTGRIWPEVAGKRQGLWGLYRRMGLMPRAALLHSAAHLAAASLRESLDASGWPRPVLARRQMRVRSQASRLNATPAGRSDWLAVETWPDRDGGQVEVILASDLEPAEIEHLLVMGLESGVGRAASVGFGQVDLTAVEPIDWPEVPGADALVTLGPCVPKRSDPSGGCWRVQTHWGKLGGSFSAGAGPVEKRPVMGLKAGAVLTVPAAKQVPADQQPATQEIGTQTAGIAGQEQQAGGRMQPACAGQALAGPSLEATAFVGRLVGGVHPKRPEVVHYGLAPVLAVRIGQ